MVVYDTLVGLQGRWDDVLSRRTLSGSGSGIGNGGAEAEGGKNEIREGIITLRQICLRSFPEFWADLKLAATSDREGEISVGLVDVTVDVSSSILFPTHP